MIKEYFKEELEETIDSILKYSDGPCLILNVITDTHYNPHDENNARRTRETYDNLYALNQRVFTHGIVHMGDVTIHGTEKDGIMKSTKGSSFNVPSTIAVIYNLVAHAVFGYETFGHNKLWPKVFFYYLNLED